MKKAWFVKHPLSLYVEDVKLLARKADLKVLSAKFEPKNPNKDRVELNPPKLTLKKKPKAKS